MRLPRAPDLSAGLERGFDIGITMPTPGGCWIMAQHLLGRPFLLESQKNADGHFRGRPVDAQVGDETSEEIVHMPLTSPALSAG